MVYRLITQLCTLLLDLIAVVCQSNQQKNFELLLLRQLCWLLALSKQEMKLDETRSQHRR